jgi:hypothetical protein
MALGPLPCLALLILMKYTVVEIDGQNDIVRVFDVPPPSLASKSIYVGVLYRNQQKKTSCYRSEGWKIHTGGSRLSHYIRIYDLYRTFELTSIFITEN